MAVLTIIYMNVDVTQVKRQLEGVQTPAVSGCWGPKITQQVRRLFTGPPPACTFAFAHKSPPPHPPPPSETAFLSPL